MTRKLIPIALAAVFIFSGATPSWAEQDCNEMLEKNCTSCHYKTRVCKKIGKKNERSWKNTTKRMIRYGLKLDNSEVKKITDCLVALDENSEKFCD